MSHHQPCLVLGTGNRKKGAELATLFTSLGLVVQTLADFPEPIAVHETGTTFAENAALKAIEQARHLDRWVLGEDSGLAVDALGGAPG
ncbi:MAG: non-canonical purine NTP pyrophosphatase, partial [Pirellulales bacterium]|nr:non-canonical purine NTP pyrophosphatase [Pirellulales bacterium]